MNTVKFAGIVSILLVAIVITYSLWWEFNDQLHVMKPKFKKIQHDNPECLLYLNYLNNYPTWRVCFVFSVFPAILAFVLFIMSKDCPLTIDIIIQNAIKACAVLFASAFTSRNILDYFRWHVMCGAYGCVQEV